MMKIIMRDMLRKAVVQAGSSDIEEAAAVTEDIPSNVGASDGEGGQTGAPSTASAEEDQQSTLGVRIEEVCYLLSITNNSSNSHNFLIF